MIQHWSIERIAAIDTRLLRQTILRPNQPPEECVYPDDEKPQSFHLGIRHNAGLIAIASFYREALPTDLTRPCLQAGSTRQDATDLRIRGMAVMPEHRGQGLGRALVNVGTEIAREMVPSPSLIWCNARTTASGYYKKLGFVPLGREFEIEGIGPHFVMVCELL